MYQKAIQIFKPDLGEKHPYSARSLNNFAAVFKAMGAYWKAEPLHRESMRNFKPAFGGRRPDYARSLNDLAGLFKGMGVFEMAEPLHQEAMQIQNKTALGERHPG